MTRIQTGSLRSSQTGHSQPHKDVRSSMSISLKDNVRCFFIAMTASRVIPLVYILGLAVRPRLIHSDACYKQEAYRATTWDNDKRVHDKEGKSSFTHMLCS